MNNNSDKINKQVEQGLPRPFINEVARSTVDSTVPYNLPDETWHALNQLYKQIDAERRSATDRERALVVPLADQIFLLARLIERLKPAWDEKSIRALQLIQEDFVSRLAQAGYQMAAFEGTEWESLNETQAEMQDYLSSETAAKPIVMETCLPMISYKGQSIRPARVIVTGPIRTNLGKENEYE